MVEDRARLLQRVLESPNQLVRAVLVDGEAREAGPRRRPHGALGKCCMGLLGYHSRGKLDIAWSWVLLLNTKLNYLDAAV